jgi:hypothetical protein
MPDLKVVTPDEWAAMLISAGLEPGPTFGYRLATGPYEVGIHIATHDGLAADERTQLIEELRKEIGNAVRRVLKCLPVSEQRQYTDGTSVTVSEASRD